MVVGQTEQFTITNFLPGAVVSANNNALTVGTVTMNPDNTGTFRAAAEGNCAVTFSAPGSSPVSHGFSVTNPTPLVYTTVSVS
jgi:hypothetical protein